MIRAIFTDDVNIVSVSGLTQWDYGRKLHISGINLPDVAQVHFASQSLYAEAVIRLSEKVDDGYVVDIPNECLREPYDIKAWVYEVDEGHGETLKTVLLPLFKRTRPKDFVNPPDPSEETLLNKWIEKINENIEDNANFKADITESEKVRVENEETRKSNETARKSAETKRANAEKARETAETERVNAENTRVEIEQARQTAESGRVSAENTRVSDENARKSAEIDRANTWNSLKNDIEQTLQSGVINDSEIKTNQTWSSNKINTNFNDVKNQIDETIEEMKSTVKGYTLLASGWVGNRYTIKDTLITTTSNQQVMLSADMSEDQENAYFGAKMRDGGQSNGQFTIIAKGDVPNIDIPIRIMYSYTLLETPRASDKVTLSDRNDTGDSIKFGIDKDGNYGYIKAGADSVVPFKKDVAISSITGGNNVPSPTLSNLVIGKKYVGTLFTTDQTLPSNLFTEGAKLIDSRYVSYASAQSTWYAHFIVFEATATISKMYKTLYLAYAKVE